MQDVKGSHAHTCTRTHTCAHTHTHTHTPEFQRFIYFYVYACFSGMYPCVPHAQDGQKKVLDPLDLELLTIVSDYMDAGNLIWTAEPSLQPQLNVIFKRLRYERSQLSEKDWKALPACTTSHI